QVRDWRDHDYTGCVDRICEEGHAGRGGHGDGPDRHDESSQGGGGFSSLCREEFAGSPSSRLSSVGCPDEGWSDSRSGNYRSNHRRSLGGRPMADPIQEEINKEVAAHKILIYGKGTKQMPMCGFTRETIQFFDKYGYPFELIDVLSQPAKREALAKMTNWPTLPKVFIDGQFYGDTDILDPMAAKGEMEPLLKKAFGK